MAEERRSGDDRRANERQVGGDHYKIMPIEHWDLAAMFSWDPFQYQITKYVMRWRDKNGVQDLEKVVHFAQKYVEVEKARAAGTLTVGILKDALTKELRQANEREEQRDHGESIRDGEQPLHLRPVT
jgi:hypothetical protein